MSASVHTIGGNYQAAVAQDRLVRKEVALGAIRELPVPQDHIGLSIAPFMDVASDDVVFDYLPTLADGLAPARAEDAESELARKDDYITGQGRASVMDWALKDHYTASDVTRYREYLEIAAQLAGGNFPLTIEANAAQFARKVARDDSLRRRKLDNRIEWLIMTALHAGKISYNDGKIRFDVDYGRPANQQAQTPASGTYASDTHDPINDILAVVQFMKDTHGVDITSAIVSKKFLLRAAQSSKFGLRAGFVGGSSGIVSPGTSDLNYLIDGYGPEFAIELLKRQTGIDFITYDSVYRTRPLNSTTTVNNRFTPQNRVIFLPDTASINETDETEIGFGKVLTSPHPEGNWGTGFYEWERSTVDPWGTDRGTGIKAFPVFMHLDKTFTWDVTL